MLSSAECHEVTQVLVGEFLENPGQFVTETDVQRRLCELLADAVSKRGKLTPSVPGTSRYKQTYIDAIEAGFETAADGFPPVHAEVSIDRGERFDVGVLADTLDTIRWDDGSKKFRAEDVAALYELKFVKNWKKPNTVVGFHPSDVEPGDLSDDEIAEEIDLEGTVDLKGDLESLTERHQVPYRCLVLLSNYNYLYHCPTEHERDHAPFYEELARVTRERLASMASDTGVNVVYAAPTGTRDGQRFGGGLWLNNADRRGTPLSFDAA